MPNRPSERITFVIEKWPTSIRVKAYLYDGDVLKASAGRSIPVPAERRESIYCAEFMDALDWLSRRVRWQVQQGTLPFEDGGMVAALIEWDATHESR